MTNFTVSKEWFEEIKGLIKVEDPYFYTEYNTEKVEFDTNEEEFYRVSKELGWL